MKIETVVIVMLEWPGESDADLDLWMVAPDGRKIGHPSRTGSGVFLDRDDLGSSANLVIDTETGEIHKSPIRKEIMHIRQPMNGEYIVVVHAYSMHKQEPTPAKVTVFHVKKGYTLFSDSHTFNNRGEERSYLRFTMKGDNIIDTSTLPYRLTR
jgi:uncharacterized protein YfaP (DUF2135 family)